VYLLLGREDMMARGRQLMCIFLLAALWNLVREDVCNVMLMYTINVQYNNVTPSVISCNINM